MSLRVLLTTWILVAAALAAAGERAGETDAWADARRDDVIAILGQPNKVKRSGSGEVLTYKLFRMRVDARPGPGVLLLDVPGVGLVGRPADEFDPLHGDSVHLEPTGMDGEGRMLAGGLHTRRTATREWNPREGGLTGPDPAPIGPGKRIKLKFELDAAGRVVAWRVSKK